jgi:DNA repair protein RadC
MTTFNAKFWMIDDSTYIMPIAARTHEDAVDIAKNLFKNHGTLLEVKQAKFRYFINVAGTVNGKTVNQEMYISSLDDSDAEKQAIKFFRKHFGAFKRKDRAEVSVETVEIINKVV